MEIDTLCAELEELFELDELMALSDELLGFPPEEIGGTTKVGSFARSLAEHCLAHNAIEALRDAVIANKPGAKNKLTGLNAESLAARTLTAGDRFGPFTIFQTLGQGPTGTVYRVQFEDRDLRLKVLRRTCESAPRGLHRFLTYSRLCKKLAGAGIPQNANVGTVDGSHYLLCDYFEGQPLDELLKSGGPLHLDDASAIIRQLLEGLDLFHSAGLTHGNIKASNILIQRLDHGRAHVQLLDPGTDRLEARAPKNGKTEVLAVAAAETAAPEIWGGEASSTESDVYAMGVVLYQMLTGRLPVEGETSLDLALSHLTEIPEPPSSVAPEGWISQPLDEYVMRLLNRSKEQRPRNADAALDAFEHLMMARSRRPPAAAEVIEERIDRLLSDPVDAGLALALEAVAEDGVHGARVAETFMQACDALSDEPGHLQARLNLAFRAGRLFRHAGELERAEEVYAKLLELEPKNRVAESALEDLRKKLGKHDELIEMWLAQAENAPGTAERAEAMAKIGALYEAELDDRSQAIVAYTQAFCDAPEKTDHARAIERLARSDQASWNDVLQSCSEAVANQTTEDSVRLLLQMGRWYGEKLNRFDLALSCYQAILSNDAANEAALSGTAQIYRRAQQWQELAQALAGQSALSRTPTQKRDLLCEAADIQATKLGEVDAAQQSYEQVLEEDPTHKAANDGLAQIYEQKQDFQGYVRLLERRVGQVRGSERSLLLCRIGELKEDRLGDLDGARESYQSVLAEDDTHIGALRGLDRVYSKQGKYGDLLSNLKEQVRLAATPRQKLTLLERIASIQEEEFLDAQLATSTYEEILELNPKHDGALTAMARLFASQGRWQDAAEIHQRHAELSEDPGRKAALYLSQARILHKHLELPEQAITAYERTLEYQRDEPEALTALASLKASAGDAEEALRAIEALAESSHDPSVKADSYVKAAELMRARGDLLGAIDRYRLALGAAPDSIAAHDGLYDTLIARDDIDAAAQLLADGIERARLDSRRAKLSAQLAHLALNRMNDVELAANAALQALDADHASALALLVMSGVMLASDRTDEALPYLERLMGLLEQLNEADALTAVFRYIDVLSASGSTEAALSHIDTVRRLAPDDRDAQLRVAEIAYEHADPHVARNLYTELLDRFDEELSEQDRFIASFRRADSTLRAGQIDMAVMLLEDVCDLDPVSPLPLRSLAEGYEQRQQWERVWEIRSRLLDLVDGDQRVDVLIALGELANEHLDDKNRALRSFVAALDERPGDRKLLARLMQLYSEEKDWTHLVEVVLKLADFQDDPAQKAKYLMTAGMLNARELGEFDAALECFAQVIDLDASNEKAFEESLTIYRDRADYASVERLLKTKMKAASAAKDSDTLLRMFDALGDLYRQLGRIDDAVDALEAAQTLDPDNRERLSKLSATYAANPGKFFDKARKLQEELLKKDPYRADAYKALRKLYTEAKNADGAWCLCQALFVLNLAGPDEERFFVRMRSEDPAYAQSVLGDEEWGLMVHPDLDPHLTRVFALIEPVVIESRGQDLERLGYNPYAAVDLQSHHAAVSQTLFYAAGVMNQQAPPTFENPNDPGGLQFLPSNPPAISIGAGLLNSDVPPQVLAFVAGHHLTCYQPGLFMRQLVPTGTGLKSWLFAAIKLMSPQFPVAPDVEGAVQEATQLLRDRLPQQSRDELARAVSKLIQSSAALDLKRWVNAVDLTADRVGFLLAHDLETAMEVVRASDEGNKEAQTQRRLKELVLFAISQPYLTLRRRLQIDLQT